MQGASGVAIADALVEVQSHCAESGESAAAAFGPAVAYAKALEMTDAAGWRAPDLVRTWVKILLAVGGVTLVLLGGTALAQDQRVELTLGGLISGGVTFALMMLVFVLGEQVLRFVVRHTVWAVVVWMATLAALVAMGLQFAETGLGSFSAPVVMFLGVVALLAWVMFTLHLRKTRQTLEDPLVDPRE